jgi:small subunit ribosomal protein S7
MSRKKTQPKKNVVPDPKFNSTIIPKLINNIMYDGKRGVAEKMNQSIFLMKLLTI